MGSIVWIRYVKKGLASSEVEPFSCIYINGVILAVGMWHGVRTVLPVEYNKRELIQQYALL
ncbi:MAG: hypothetical protein ACRCTF_04725 [Bacteroidales bacterium]